jgi:uncharacterized protein
MNTDIEYNAARSSLPDATEAAAYRPVPWTLRDVVLASLAALGLLFAGVIIVIVIGVLAGFVGVDVTSATSSPLIVLAVMGLEALFLIPAWIWGPHKYGRDIRWLGFRSTSIWPAVLLTIGGLLVIVLINVVWAAIASRLNLPGQPDLVPLFGEGPLGLAVALVVASVIAPVSEEVLFRGFMYPGMRERWGVAMAVIVSSAVFSVFHLSLSTFIPIAVMGAVFALLYERTDSIWPPIALHALVNLFGVLSAYSMSAI